MVTVDKYIRKLLFEQDCVIIPDFGGILTHYVGAQYDANLGIFQPSRKRLAFNEVLKLDDGLLTYYISSNEKIHREEAAQSVKKYVDSLRSRLKEGQTVTLDSIGVFSTNSEGKLVFEPDQAQNYNSEWYGYEAIRVRELAVTKNLPLVSESKINGSETELTEVAPAPSLHRPSWLSWVAAAVMTGAVVTMSFLHKPDGNTLLSSLNPFESGVAFYESSFNQISTKVTAITSSAFFDAKPNEVVSERPAPKPMKPSLGHDGLQPVAIPVEVLTEAPFEPVVKPVQVEKAPVKVPMNYFLIAGSFGRMKNAIDLRNQLVREGFVNTQILDSDEGKLIKVAAGAYVSMGEALNDKPKIDEITFAESWVYHKK